MCDACVAIGTLFVLIEDDDDVRGKTGLPVPVRVIIHHIWCFECLPHCLIACAVIMHHSVLM